MQKIHIENSAMLPAGFRSAGLRCGLKKREHHDISMVVSDTPATVAGVFTTNQVKAATVRLCQSRLKRSSSRGLVVNSGNANACTGEQGRINAERMASCCSEALGGSGEEFMVCSTGHIGMQLPMDLIEPGISRLAGQLAEGDATSAAEGIMTTDTHPKFGSVQLMLGGKPVRITGMAKGAGMIEPNMATMLSFLFTDAAVDQAALQTCLRKAVDRSFNRITVDGDQSTNDTVLFFANGQADNEVLLPGHPDWELFCEAVWSITFRLAMMIVRDGEGASKLVTIRVEGARSDHEADAGARAVANSLLVKTSWAGRFAIWGRVMDSIGYSDCFIDEEKTDIDYDDVAAVRGGLHTGVSAEALSEVIARDAFTIRVNLHVGSGSAEVYTCEISQDYVKINVV